GGYIVIIPKGNVHRACAAYTFIFHDGESRNLFFCIKCRYIHSHCSQVGQLIVPEMNIVIKFIYAQYIPIDPEMPNSLICDLIFTADKMQLKGLFDKFWTIYTTSITVENFLHVWQLAEIFNQHETVNSVHKFILTNSKKISRSGKLPEISARKMESIIDNLSPNNLSDFIILLISWEKQKKVEGVLQNLIPKCHVREMSDSSLQNLLSNEVVKSAQIYSMLSTEVVTRWLTRKAQIQIFAFKLTPQKCEHQVFCLNKSERLSREEHVLDVENGETHEKFFAAVSGTGNVFYFQCLPNDSGIIAIERSTGEKYSQIGQVMSDDLVSHTSNFKEVFFRRTNTSYWCFNFDLKTWRLLEFIAIIDQILLKNLIDDCAWMILATEDGKYFFEIEDYEDQIKIVDIKTATCETRNKLPGNWNFVRCKNLGDISQKKLIFVDLFFHFNFLIYDIDYDCWSLIALPDIQHGLSICVSYDDDCLLVEKPQINAGIGKCNIYSLKTRKKVTEFISIEQEHDLDHDLVYFDASFKI
uniref:Uncharacterized protein n=1 Tax=Strigamia maritima TaxID=126957 RepID=T1J072_STRMM